jgi:hypothetical protein
VITSLLNPENKTRWFYFHVFLGLLSLAGNWFLIFWYYLVLIWVLYQIVTAGHKTPLYATAGIVYIASLEVCARMLSCSPLIPWESGKYIFILLVFAGRLFYRRASSLEAVGWLLLILLLPSVLIDRSGQVSFLEIVFNIFGWVAIGLAMLLFPALNVSRSMFRNVLRLLIFIPVTVLFYTFIKTPDYNDLEFSLVAQTSTTGGFGSNQISTVLGLGFFMMCYCYLMKERLTGYRIGDGLLAILFLIQGLITFSRGGMISAVLALIAFMIVSGFIKLFFGKDRSYAMGSFLILVGVVMSVFYVNKLTDGNLFLRYSGETSGTLAGHRDRNLTTLTTGRDEIALEDWRLWKQAPFFGSGAGSSKHLREVRTGVAAHLEPTRLLAEQGLLGIFILIIAFYNIYMISRQTDRLTKAFKLALLVMAFSTMFHSSMRTYVIPVSLAVCMINVPLVKRRDYLPRK